MKSLIFTGSSFSRSGCSWSVDSWVVPWNSRVRILRDYTFDDKNRSWRLRVFKT